MVEVGKKSWHFRLYSWFNEGKLPRIIDLCSYCRTVMFWAPLKAIFYLPAAWLHKKNRALPYLVLIFLAGAIDVLMLSVFHTDWLVPYWFTFFVYFLFAYHPRLRETVASDWDEAEDTRLVRYTKKTGRVISAGLKYSIGLPLKTILWTIWVKMYDFHKALFWSVLCLAVAAIFYGLYLIDWWLQALIVIAVSVLIILLGRLLAWFIIKKGVSLKDSLVWQFLVAQKRKICPFIEPRD